MLWLRTVQKGSDLGEPTLHRESEERAEDGESDELKCNCRDEFVSEKPEARDETDDHEEVNEFSEDTHVVYWEVLETAERGRGGMTCDPEKERGGDQRDNRHNGNETCHREGVNVCGECHCYQYSAIYFMAQWHFEPELSMSYFSFFASIPSFVPSGRRWSIPVKAEV